MHKTIILILAVSVLQAEQLPRTQQEEYDIAIQQASNNLNNSPDSATYYANRAYSILKNSTKYDQQINALMMGVNGSIMNGQWSQAYDYCLEALLIAKQHELSHRTPQILSELGNIFMLNGLHAEAIVYLIDGIHIADSVGSTAYLEDLYFYLGLLYSDIHDLENCNIAIRKSIEYSQINNNPSLALNNYILLSNISTSFDSISYCLSEAEQILKVKPDYHYEKVAVRNNQALISKAIGDYPTARAQYLEAIAISEENGFTGHLGDLYNNYAYLLMAEEKYDSARISLDLALEAAHKIQSLDLEASIYDSYSDYFKAIGDYESALEYSDISIKKRNEFVEQQRVQESMFLSVVFETEEKEKEILIKENKLSRTQAFLFGALALAVLVIAIAIYFRQKSKLRRVKLANLEKSKSLEVANAVIEGQDGERKRLAMDLHDGAGMQLGALKLQLDAYYGMDENFPKIENLIDGVGSNIREISHRMAPARLDEVGLKQSIEDMINSICKTDKVEIELMSDLDQRLDAKLEINLYYLILEILHNATKHSEADNVSIQMYLHKNVISVSIEDDGVGMDLDKATSGHGIKNIKRRVELLDGSLRIDSKPELGTVFMIEIPIKKND